MEKLWGDWYYDPDERKVVKSSASRWLFDNFASHAGAVFISCSISCLRLLRTCLTIVNNAVVANNVAQGG